MYIALKSNLTTNLIMKTFLVNYHLPKGEGASCFSDKGNPSSPQALIPTIPAVLFFTNANRFILLAANYSTLLFTSSDILPRLKSVGF